MELLTRFFPELTETQLAQYAQLQPLYEEWNAQINVISRKDIENLYEHHVLHSLAIAKVMQFVPKSVVLDLGSGGGFPGIPLAIMFPEVKFILADSIGKKMKVAQAVADGIGLKNVTTKHSRVEDLREKVDFTVCRAVAPLPDLIRWTRKHFSAKHLNPLPNGLLALKGEEPLRAELKDMPKGEYCESHPLHKIFRGLEYFEGKCCVYVQG